MNDEPDAAPDEGAAAPEGRSTITTPLMIGAQYIKDLSFENPRGPEALVGVRETPQIGVEINTSARNLGENVYEATLFIRGEATAQEKSLFIVELTYGCIATVGEGVPQDAIRPLLLIEVPRHLFPFARNIVSSATRDGGFPPLMINPIDFAALYREQHGEASQNAGEATA